MTTENSPSVIDQSWKTQWRTQRYERLLDTISEYLCDDSEFSGAEAFISDVVQGLKETRDWPQRQIEQIDLTLEAIKNVS